MKLPINQDKMFDLTIILSYILYFAIYFNLLSKAPQYLYILQTSVKLYISLYLIIKFNFISDMPFTKFDKKIAFNAGLFLFTTLAFGDIYYLINNISSQF